MPAIEEIIENFEFLDDWEDRYRYLIDLGKELQPMNDADKNEQNRVQGCTSQVWIVAGSKTEVVDFVADSDAHIVRGLIAVVMALFNHKPPQEILNADADEVFGKLGLHEHLTPSRRNGLAAMVERIKKEAAART